MQVVPDPAQLLPNRRAVGQRLSDRLLDLRGQRPVVLAIARGGVPVGFEMARVLGGEFDVIVSLELSVPDNPHKVLGAVAEFGGQIISSSRVDSTDHMISELEVDVQRVMREVARRSRIYRGDREFPDLEARTVVVVTDGAIEPWVPRAALRGVWTRLPRRVVFATGVMSRVSLLDVRHDASEVISLREPEYLSFVGEWYRELPPVLDSEIQALLRSSPAGIAH